MIITQGVGQKAVRCKKLQKEIDSVMDILLTDNVSKWKNYK